MLWNVFLSLFIKIYLIRSNLKCLAAFLYSSILFSVLKLLIDNPFFHLLTWQEKSCVRR